MTIRDEHKVKAWDDLKKWLKQIKKSESGLKQFADLILGGMKDILRARQTVERNKRTRRMKDTQKLRMLINRVDAIMRAVAARKYELQSDVQAVKLQSDVHTALREALMKTGAWVH